MNKILQGNALEKLKELESESVNCVMNSPPYWALRDYGVDVETIWDCDGFCVHDFSLNKVQAGTSHWNQGGKVIPTKERKIHNEKLMEVGFCNKCGAWKGQLGLEPTFDLYIKHLCDIFDEVKRVLRKDGTCWVNLGDTYSGSGGTAGQKEGTKNLGYDTHKMGATSQKEIVKDKWVDPKYSSAHGKRLRAREHTENQLKSKSLTLIPMRFAIEMVNRGWILRNVIIWHKPNCMPSSVKDRFTVDFEYLFFFSKSKKYWFETQYEPVSPNSDFKEKKGANVPYAITGNQNLGKGSRGSPLGRNKRAVWKICPKPFKEAHFAVYPEELCETPIKAGCPEFVCVKCGKPKVLDVEYKREETRPGKESKYTDDVYVNSNVPQGLKKRVMCEIKSKGYKPTCNCNAGFTSGIVLDPFFGAGTTGLVALKQNKKFIGIELNPEYIEIATKRLKPFMEQEKLK